MKDKAPDSDTLVTNFSVNRLPIYEKAIQKFNKGDLIYIKKEAYDIAGNIMPKNMSIHCDKWVDLSDFWNIFEEIKNKK
jgi:hypothetical protein